MTELVKLSPVRRRLIAGGVASLLLASTKIVAGQGNSPADRLKALGLDRPIWQQYLLYVGNALHGDLGVSIVRGDPVASDLLRRFPATVELAVPPLPSSTL